MKDSLPLQSDTISYNDGNNFNQLLIDLCAFANNQGGEIYCGVNAKGKLVGLEPNTFISQLVLRSEGAFINVISWSYETIIVGHKYIIKIVVEKSSKIIQLKDQESKCNVYYRVNNHSVIASKIILSYIKLEKGLVKKTHEFNNETFNSVIFLLKNFGELSLSQLYSQSNFSKSEIDAILPYLLYTSDVSVRWNGGKFVFIS